ncbi:MAG: DUF6624 domain-containing protein [Bacteroidota bacterium]
MNATIIAKRIIQLKKADLALRDRLIKEGLLFEGYHEEMEALHNRNAQLLEEMMEEMGYPSIDKVGREASEAAWLVIQHAIGQPRFVRKCLTLLESAVEEGKANPQHLAYLTDRIAVFEGQPQLYGTQFDWDDRGELSPYPFDDLSEVNRRRRALGLNTLEEQTVVIRKRAIAEKESPPANMEERRKKFEAWRKSVGWIT